MSRTSALTITAFIATAVLLAGCSHSSRSASSGSVGGAYAPDALPAASAAAAAGSAAGSAASGDSASGGSASGGSASGAGTTPAKNAAAALVLGSTSLIKTADLTVQVKLVSKQADQALQIAAQAGGAVTADVRTAGTTNKDGQEVGASADLTLAVPPASLEPVLLQLDGLGAEISRHTSTQDVTGQVADVSSRVSSAEASIGQLQSLFAKAQNVSDILALENDLAQREADLESLQAQQRALSAQTANAMITLHLVDVPVKTPTPVVRHTNSHGFAGGLRHGWHAFTASMGWVFTALGALLPFLVLLALIGGAYVLARRRLNARHIHPLPPVQAAEPADAASAS